LGEGLAGVAPMVALPGVVSHSESSRQATDVLVYGVDARFFTLHGVTEPHGLEGRGAFVSAALGTELQAREGDALLVKLNQVGTLSTPDPTLIPIQPWDPKILPLVEKAIRTSDLDLNPQNDGKIIRIPVPPLTEERRKELSKLVHKYAEEGRNGVRQVRRDANDKLKKLLKDSKISQDDERKGLDEVQKITDQHVHLIDDIQKKKDTELLGK